MIICKTPLRISYFGGGTDFPSWYKKNNGQVISSSIDKYCYLMIRNLPPFFHFNYRIRYFKSEFTKKISEINLLYKNSTHSLLTIFLSTATIPNSHVIRKLRECIAFHLS